MSFGISAATAALIGTGVSAAATIYSGVQAGKAQKNAAKTASDTELRMFEQTREDQAPYREAGYTALGQLGKGLEDGGDFNRDFTMSDFYKDPGYQFRLDEGTKALERSAAARGGLLSGRTGKELTRYGSDYASGEYSNAYQRFNADRTTRFNRLASMAGVGQTSLSETGQLGAQTAGRVADNITGAGNASAATAINTGNAIQTGIGNLGQFYLQNQYLKKLPNAAGAP